MQKLKTTDDILKDRNLFTQEQAERIEVNSTKEALNYWGGKRENAGRKSLGRDKQIRLNVIELEFIKQARELGANLNLIDLTQYAQ